MTNLLLRQPTLDSNLKATQQSYHEIKEHFMLRFQQIDREFILQSDVSPEEHEQITANKVVAFVQEGIGALLAYLPTEVAVSTLKDFLAILQPEARELTAVQIERESSNVPVRIGQPVAQVSQDIINPIEIVVQPHRVVQEEFKTIGQPQLPPPQLQAVPQQQVVVQRAPEPTLIEGTSQHELQEISGQVDFLAAIGHDKFIVGSTTGQVAIYDAQTMSMIKMLMDEGLSIYEMVYSMRTRRICIACESAWIFIFEIENFEKVGQVKVQHNSITALLYVRDEVLVAGQAEGYLDVILFSKDKATVTHSLQIREAGDINSLCLGPKPGEFMIASQKGLIKSQCTQENTFQIVDPIEEYVSLYTVNVSWAGEQKYVIITTRPRYANKKEIPRGQENYAIVSYTLFDDGETDPDQRQIILGQYRTSFDQACFPLAKVQVIVPRPTAVEEGYQTEAQYRGRFFFCMIDSHLKIIDAFNYRLFDLLSEPGFDQEAVNGMCLSRSLKNKKSRLMLLCNGENGNTFIQRIEFNDRVPTSLNSRLIRQMEQNKAQKNQLGPSEL